MIVAAGTRDGESQNSARQCIYAVIPFVRQRLCLFTIVLIIDGPECKQAEC